MTHDPLCRATSGTFCDCPLIARVREDERGAALRDAFNRMINKEHPDKQFDVTVHHENNLFGPTTTVALLAKVRL